MSKASAANSVLVLSNTICTRLFLTIRALAVSIPLMPSIKISIKTKEYSDVSEARNASPEVNSWIFTYKLFLSVYSESRFTRTWRSSSRSSQTATFISPFIQCPSRFHSSRACLKKALEQLHQLISLIKHN